MYMPDSEMRILENGKLEVDEPNDFDIYFVIEDGIIKILVMGKIDE